MSFGFVALFNVTEKKNKRNFLIFNSFYSINENDRIGERGEGCLLIYKTNYLGGIKITINKMNMSSLLLPLLRCIMGDNLVSS